MAKNKKVKKKVRRSVKNLLLGGAVARRGNRYPNGTQSLVPIEDIEQGLIITEDGRYVKILEVLPTSQSADIIYYFEGYLKIAPSSLQILVRTERANIDAYCSQMEAFYNKEKNENCRAMIYEDAQLVNYLADNEAVTHRFYLAFAYDGTSTELDVIAKELDEQAQVAYQYLDNCGLEVIRQSDYNGFTIKALYSITNKAIANSVDLDHLSDQLAPVYNAEVPEEELDDEDEDGRLNVRDLLACGEADTRDKGYLLIDGVYHTYLYITGYGYPTQTIPAWLSPLVELGEGISLSFYLDRKRKEQILPKVSKTTMINRTRMRDVGDTRTDYESLDDAIQSGYYIKDSINRNNQDFYYMHTLIEVTADDEQTLKERIKRVENLCRSMDWIVRRADYKHEQCYRSMLPLASLDPEIEKKSRRNVLTNGAAAAFPFQSYELCDSNGILLGINLHNDSLLLVDFYDTQRYSNGNLAIFGATGAGKTFTILLCAMRLRMCGVKVFIITPEKGFEYRDACEAMGGQFFRISPGSDDQINLMEITRTTLDIDSEMADNVARNDSVLLDKVQDIHTYLALRYPGMTPEEDYQLNIALLECYDSFGITRDNHSLLGADGKFKPMPDFKHLHPFLLKYPILKNVALVVQELVEFGMGGQTNINVHSDFIVLDTSGAKKKDISSCTFIATSFIRDQNNRNRVRKTAVIGDELWKIAGEEGNEQAADFVIEVVKTIRGYGGIFISATQNTIDYFALREGKFGDSLLNNSRLKLLLQMEEAEARTLQGKLGLSDEETLQIIRCGRGQGLLCAGKLHVAVEIRSSQTEYDLITTNRADLEKRTKS